MISQIIIGTALFLSLILSWILKLSMQKGDRMIRETIGTVLLLILVVGFISWIMSY